MTSALAQDTILSDSDQQIIVTINNTTSSTPLTSESQQQNSCDGWFGRTLYRIYSTDCCGMNRHDTRAMRHSAVVNKCAFIAFCCLVLFVVTGVISHDNFCDRAMYSWSTTGCRVANITGIALLMIAVLHLGGAGRVMCEPEFEFNCCPA